MKMKALIRFMRETHFPYNPREDIILGIVMIILSLVMISLLIYDCMINPTVIYSDTVPWIGFLILWILVWMWNINESIYKGERLYGK